MSKFSVLFCIFYFIYAGSKDNHYISDKFEIWLDPTTDSSVGCP